MADEEPKIVVRDPDGKYWKLPQRQVGAAVAQGFAVPTSAEELQQAKRQQAADAEAQTLTGKAKAFTEGALGAATFGYAPTVARNLLGDEYSERAELRSETGAAKLGQATGIIAPALVSGGSALPAGAVARVGGALGRGVEQQALKALGGGAAARIGAKAAGYGTEGAVTGAMVQMGANMNEASIKDEELTSELLMSDVGESTMMGLGFGALLGGGIGAGKEAYGAAKRLGGRLRDGAASLDESRLLNPKDNALGGGEGESIVDRAVDYYADASSKISGNDREVIKKAMTDRSVRQDYLMKDELREAFSKRAAADLDAVLDTKTLTKDISAGELKAENVARTVKRGSETLVAARQQADRVLQLSDDMVQDARAVAREVKAAEKNLAKLSKSGDEAAVAAATQDLATLRARSETAARLEGQFGTKNAKSLQQRAERARQRLAKAIDSNDEAEIYVALENTKRDYDVLARNAERSRINSANDLEMEGNRATFDFARSRATEIRKFLENGDVWGQAGLNQARRNEALHKVLGTSRDFESRFVKTFAEGEAGSYGANKIRKGDATKLDSYYRRLGRDGDMFEHQQTLRHLDSEDELLTALIEGGEVPAASLQKVEGAREAVRRLKQEFATAGERLSNANLIEEMINKEQGSLMQGAALLGGLSFGPLGTAAGMAFSALARPGTMARQIAVLESVAQRAQGINDAMRDAVGSFVRGRKPSRFGGLRSQRRRTGGAFAGFGQDQAERRKTYRKKAAQLQRLQSDPEQLIFAMQRITDGLEQPAPSLTAQISAQHARSVAYLVEQLPQPPSYIRSVADREAWTPSSPEITAFERKYRAVSDPMSVIEDARKGNLTPEAVEALRATKPKLWEAMRLAAMDAVAEADHHVDYSVTVQLAILFDFAAAPTLEPEFLHTHQQMMAARSEEQAAAQEAKKQAMPPPKTLSTQSATLSERVAMNT